MPLDIMLIPITSQINSALQVNNTYLVDCPTILTLLLPPTDEINNGDFIIIVDRGGKFSTAPCIIEVIDENQSLIQNSNKQLLLAQSFSTIQLIFYDNTWSLYGTEAFSAGRGNSFFTILNRSSTNITSVNCSYLLSNVSECILPPPTTVFDGDFVEIFVSGPSVCFIKSWSNEQITTLDKIRPAAKFVWSSELQVWILAYERLTKNLDDRAQFISLSMAINSY